MNPEPIVNQTKVRITTIKRPKSQHHRWFKDKSKKHTQKNKSSSWVTVWTQNNMLSGHFSRVLYLATPKNPKLFIILKSILSTCEYGTVLISLLSKKEKYTSMSFEKLIWKVLFRIIISEVIFQKRIRNFSFTWWRVCAIFFLSLIYRSFDSESQITTFF